MMPHLFAADNIWSQDTQTLSSQESEQAFKSYTQEHDITLKFADDIVIKEASDIEDNILTVGVSLGYGTSTETVSNTTGSYDLDHTLGVAKVIIGKDFTFFHEEYTQPVRIYLTYAYTLLSEGVDYSTITIGIKENMRYWPLYKTNKYIIYPTLSYEIGNSSLKRASTKISGLTSEFRGGVNYARGHFEYGLEIAYNSIAWDHPIDGIKDESVGLQLHLCLNYRWMHDE